VLKHPPLPFTHPQIKEILGKLGDRRQSLLFSATLPRSLADFAAAGLTSPQLVRLDTERRVSPDLSQLFFTVRQEDKVAALLHLVQEVVPAGQLTIVFVATKHHVEYLAHLMARENIQAACVYGSMDQVRREMRMLTWCVGGVVGWANCDQSANTCHHHLFLSC
jgi:ATP-dependent RNA helicase DDX54/DBP10